MNIPPPPPFIPRDFVEKTGRYLKRKNVNPNSPDYLPRIWAIVKSKLEPLEKTQEEQALLARLLAQQVTQYFHQQEQSYPIPQAPPPYATAPPAEDLETRPGTPCTIPASFQKNP